MPGMLGGLQEGLKTHCRQLAVEKASGGAGGLGALGR
jgi:hypothetical protein